MNRYLNKLRVQRAFLLAMAALALVFFVLLVWGNIGGQDRVLYNGGADFLADALKTEAYARALNPYSYSETVPHVPFKDANYPPLAYLLFYVMNLISLDAPFSPWGVAVAVICMVLCFVALYAACRPLLAQKGVWGHTVCLALFLSGTAWLAFERGNIIVLATALTAFFLAFFASENRVLKELAFIALALAAAMKIYPALFGLLLLRDKRWKEALRLALYGVLAVFAPFLLLEGGFANLPLMLENFSAHAAAYGKYTYPRFGFRLPASLCYEFCWSNPWLERNVWKLGEKMFALLPAADLLLSLLCLVYAMLAKESWRRILAVVLVLINYPLNSGAYTALYLFPVILLFLSSDALQKKDLWYLAAFLAILSPVQTPIPYDLLGITNRVIVNLTDLLRCFVAYLLFILVAVKGVLAAAAFLKERKTPTNP